MPSSDRAQTFAKPRDVSPAIEFDEPVGVFLDVDGTLLDIAERPDDVVILRENSGRSRRTRRRAQRRAGADQRPLHRRTRPDRSPIALARERRPRRGIPVGMPGADPALARRAGFAARALVGARRSRKISPGPPLKTNVAVSPCTTGRRRRAGLSYARRSRGISPGARRRRPKSSKRIWRSRSRPRIQQGRGHRTIPGAPAIPWPPADLYRRRRH